MSSHDRPPENLSDAWRDNVARHRGRLRLTRSIFRTLPADPRCKFCYAPFAGAGSRLIRPFGYRPSRKNPQMCAACIEKGPDGGFEDEAGILFADVRGFTTLSETTAPTELGELMNRFYETASEILVRHDGIVDKLVGDAVMGLFWPPLVDGDVLVHMVEAGEELLRALEADERSSLPVGVGLDFGRVYMGNVGPPSMRDFTALGDAVNTASRLQGAAGPGQLIMSGPVYQGVGERYPGSEAVDLELKGKSAPVAAWIVDVGRPVPVPAAP
jgi:adenylate cyclase